MVFRMWTLPPTDDELRGRRVAHEVIGPALHGDEVVRRRLAREGDVGRGSVAAGATWAAKGCFNVTSTRVVFSDQFCQKKHLPDENLRRDDHLGPNNEL